MTDLNAYETIPLAGSIEESIVDGPGLRFVIFTQGCPHHCPGCHNPETHPFTGGTQTSLLRLLEAYTENPLLDGMTFSGGEPFLHAKALSRLARAVHQCGGTIVTYTGYTYEALKNGIRNTQRSDWQALLEETDLLIDGPYRQELRDLDLTFRGSSNQRLLDRCARAALDEAETGDARSQA